MADHRRNVARRRVRLDLGEIVGEARIPITFPIAQQIERSGRKSIKHQWGETDAAIAGDDCGDALRHLRFHGGAAEHQRIVVRMRIDEAWVEDCRRLRYSAAPERRRDRLSLRCGRPEVATSLILQATGTIDYHGVGETECQSFPWSSIIADLFSG